MERVGVSQEQPPSSVDPLLADWLTRKMIEINGALILINEQLDSLEERINLLEV